jgi:hypothetical protein
MDSPQYNPNDATWLKRALEYNYDTAYHWFLTGLMDDDTDWALYQFYWRNSAPRFSSVAERYELKV